MKFLIAEDEEDLREIISILVTSNYDISVHQAIDGENAIELIDSDGPFDLVISDFNMPNKNGYDVYEYLRSKQPNTPFLLITTDPAVFKARAKNATFCDFLDKPFNEDELTKKVERLFSQKQLNLQKQTHIAVNLEILRRIENPGVSLYIKLNEAQYIKVLKDDALFNEKEYVRFKNKKLTSLYVELIDIKQLIANFRKNVFAQTEWNNVDTTKALEHLETDWTLILDANRHFGWPESLAELAKENIAKTLALIEKNPDTKKVFEKLKSLENKNQLPPHCYALVLLTTAILKEVGWHSESTIRKMTFACLLHDMELNEMMFKNKINLLQSEKMEQELNQQTNYLIFNHALKAAEFVQNWSSCPSDVDKIIYQHHEKPDGSGFPQKLTFLNIFPLAAIFIMAEDLVYKQLTDSHVNLYEYFKQKDDFYNRGDLKKIYEATLTVIKNG